MAKRSHGAMELETRILEPSQPSSSGPALVVFGGAEPVADDPTLKLELKSRSAQSAPVLHLRSDRVTWTGRPLTEDEQPCRYALGVMDEERAILWLKPVPVYSMHSEIVGLRNAVDSTTESNRVTNQDRKSLGEAFGTRKSQQAIRAYERGQINVDTLADVATRITAAIDDKAKDLMTTSQVEKANESQRPIPPFDTETSAVEKVYPIHGIIPDSEMALIPSAAWMLKKKMDFQEERDKGIWPQHILSQLETAVMRKDERRVKLILFLHFMIQLRNLTPGKLGRKTALQEACMYMVPASSETRLYKLFTQMGEKPSFGSGKSTPSSCKRVRLISAESRDLLVAYIATLALHIYDFHLDPAPLAGDLKLTPTKLTSVFRQLGCQIESKTVEGRVTRTVRLLAPVQFPKPPRGARRNK